MSNDIMSGGINTVLPNDPPQVIEWVNQNRDAQKKIEELVLLRKARNSENRRRSSAVKKKDDTHKMAEANRAFSHYRW